MRCDGLLLQLYCHHTATSRDHRLHYFAFFSDLQPPAGDNAGDNGAIQGATSGLTWAFIWPASAFGLSSSCKRGHVTYWRVTSSELCCLGLAYSRLVNWQGSIMLNTMKVRQIHSEADGGVQVDIHELDVCLLTAQKAPLLLLILFYLSIPRRQNKSIREHKFIKAV